MLILGIESTCDETACAIVRNGTDILSNIVASQIDLHAVYGGVVPELACRRHIDLMIPVIQQALAEAKVTLHDITAFSVAHGPGLVGALLLGLNTAKTLSMTLKKPFIGVNHIEAHLYAAIMSQETAPTFPCLGVVLSGGHTALVLINHIGSYKIIGQTVDDAIGEAFDKVAKMIGLPYPGGPNIERLAKNGDHKRYQFKPGKVKNHPLAFSFSGLKTSVLYAIKGQNAMNDATLSESDKEAVAASFQETALGDVLHKTKAAARQYGCKTLIFGGGVTNNNRLRELFAEQAPYLNCLWPSHGLSLDNAAMIAGLGFHLFQHRPEGDSLQLEALPRLFFE